MVEARDIIADATDVACGVDNNFGGVVVTKHRHTIELGLRRLTAAGWTLASPGSRVVPEGAVDAETVERVARALCTEDYRPRWTLLGDDGPRFIDQQWPTYVSRAEAALRALAEPKPAPGDAQ